MGRFDSGGRYFGGFWENLPKNVRLRGLRIEDGTLLVSTIHNSTRVLPTLSRRASHRQASALKFSGTMPPQLPVLFASIQIL
jgi:hypothetical protein